MKKMECHITFAVVAILASVLPYCVYTSVRLKFERYRNAKDVAAKIDMEMLATSLDNFKTDVGRYPTTNENLAILITPPKPALPNWKGPYIRRLPTTPWGRPYFYNSPGQNGKPFDLACKGKDGKSFTAAEVIPEEIPN